MMGSSCIVMEQHTQYFYYRKISQDALILPNLSDQWVIGGFGGLGSCFLFYSSWYGNCFPFHQSLWEHPWPGIGASRSSPSSSQLPVFSPGNLTHHISALKQLSPGQMKERTAAVLLVAPPAHPCCRGHLVERGDRCGWHSAKPGQLQGQVPEAGPGCIGQKGSGQAVGTVFWTPWWYQHLIILALFGTVYI